MTVMIDSHFFPSYGGLGGCVWATFPPVPTLEWRYVAHIFQSISARCVLRTHLAHLYHPVPVLMFSSTVLHIHLGIPCDYFDHSEYVTAPSQVGAFGRNSRVRGRRPPRPGRPLRGPVHALVTLSMKPKINLCTH